MLYLYTNKLKKNKTSRNYAKKTNFSVFLVNAKNSFSFEEIAVDDD